MSRPILFISDLHLEDSRPDITASFFDFLDKYAGMCDSLFILGDFFEVWIGDDESTPLSESVAKALLRFQQTGSAVYIMHGNRDFLIGDQYAQSCGAKLISDPYTLTTSEADDILLLHGDSLCTDDTAYMEFRTMVRNSDWQKEFLAQSLDSRREFAQQARAESQQATAEKQAEIMDVNQNAVHAAFANQMYVTMIHGHTHRPKVHKFQLESGADEVTDATRLVLGDWDKFGWYAELNHGELSLHKFPLSEA